MAKKKPREYYVNGISQIEDIDGALRLTFYQIRKPAVDWSGRIEQVEKVVIIMPLDAVCIAAMQAAEAVRSTEQNRLTVTN